MSRNFRLAVCRRGKWRLFAAAASGASEAGAEINRRGLGRKENIIERRLDWIERLRRLLRCCGRFDMSLLLDLLLGIGAALDVLDTGDAFVRAEYRRLAWLEPDIAQHASAAVIRVR